MINYFKRNNTRLRFVLFLIALLFLCVLPLSQTLYRASTKDIYVQIKEWQMASVKENLVEQMLIAEGSMRKLSLYLLAPSGALYKDAKITFSIIQNEQVLASLTIPASHIKNGMYNLDNLAKNIKAGKVVLQITGTEFPEGTDLYCLFGSSPTSGLPAAHYNGNLLAGPLLVSYKIIKLDGAFLYDTVLLILLLFVIAGVAWLFANKREWLVQSYGLYFCSFFLIFLFVSLNNPSASFQGDPRSEMVYEFWYKAHEWGFFRSFMSLMSGESLTWLERLFIWLAHTFAPQKYVFVVVACMSLMLISAICSMFCLRTFRQYFSPETRLIVSFLLGTSVLFFDAYYLWAISYWTALFLIAFSFVDMNRLKRWQYVLALLFTVILCVSRIYHAVFIPIALWLIVFFYRKLGKRFVGYMLTIAISSAFEVGYSFLHGAGNHLSAGLAISPTAILGNTLYYQIQVLSSLILGKSFQIAVVANATMLVLFLIVIGMFLYWLFGSSSQVERAGIIAALGMLSIGTIMINVITCAMSNTVMFPINYASPISWTRLYYQQADLHFSYAYFAVITILLVLLYNIKEYIKLQAQASAFSMEQMMPVVRTTRYICLSVSVLVAVLFCGRSLLSGLPLSMLPTDWKKIHYVTERDSYYLSVNTAYGVAHISMEHNSYCLIYGKDSKGDGYFWKPGLPEYTHNEPYSFADIGVAKNTEELQIITLTAMRAQNNFSSPYFAVFYDRTGKQLARLKQANSYTRVYADFFPDLPLTNVFRVAFENEDGTPAYVCDALQLGIKRN